MGPITEQHTACDRALDRYLNTTGQRLRDAAVLVEQERSPRGRWKARAMSRTALLEIIDGAARRPSTDPKDRRLCQDLAAWIRGQTAAVEVVVWSDGTIERGTVTRAA
jgi:hypothetical protein